MSKPWEKLPKESSKAFAGFHTYLGLGPQRSLKAAAEKLQKSLKSLELWSQRFGWTERALEYDAHLVKVEEEAKEIELRAKAVDWSKRQLRLKEEEWGIAEAIFVKLREWLALPLGDLSPRDAAYWAEVASRLGRVAAGLPSVVKDQPNEARPVIQINVKEALMRVYGRPGESLSGAVHGVGEGGGLAAGTDRALPGCGDCAATAAVEGERVSAAV